MISFHFHHGLDGKEVLLHLYALYLYMQLYAMLSEGYVPSGIGDIPSKPLEQRAKEALNDKKHMLYMFVVCHFKCMICLLAMTIFGKFFTYGGLG